MNLLADISIAPEGGFEGFGPLGQSGETGVSQFSSIISMAIGVMTIVAIIWFLFVLITGAISMIGSGGDKQAMEISRKKISTAVIGLVVVIVATFLLDLIGSIFDIPFLDINLLFNQVLGL